MVKDALEDGCTSSTLFLRYLAKRSMNRDGGMSYGVGKLVQDSAKCFPLLFMNRLIKTLVEPSTIPDEGTFIDDRNPGKSGDSRRWVWEPPWENSESYGSKDSCHKSTGSWNSIAG